MHLCWRFSIIYLFLPIFLIFVPSQVDCSKHLIRMTEEKWRDCLEGEWMIEFYAPWCPACKDLGKAWKSFADWSKELDVHVAEVDVTKNPGLSGRFLVTALPTIYHVKDGVFRQYSGPRDKDDFITFIEEKKWSLIEPITSLRNPDSFQMGIVAVFFKLSMSVRDAHNHLVESKGVPVWGSYCAFAGATLLLGCLLGFLIVCLIDCAFPSTVKAAAAQKKTEKQQQKKSKKQENQSETNEDNNENIANGTADHGSKNTKKTK